MTMQPEQSHDQDKVDLNPQITQTDQNNTEQPKSPNKSINKKVVIVFASIILLAIVGFLVFAFMMNKPQSNQSTNNEVQNNSQNGSDFGQQKKSPHFESSTPQHGSTLAGAPNQVVIDFDFDLAKPSNISIVSSDKEYAIAETVIDEDLTSMRRDMDLNAPDGIYQVSYKACWPDKSCHDGSFSFKIDRSIASSYTDLRNQKEVTIDMESIKFKPENVLISKGTKVTWVNKEAVTHYVNTDSHPAHTHQLDFNSKALDNGESYSYTFEKNGAYPYHCSAHATQMTGNILVD